MLRRGQHAFRQRECTSTTIWGTSRVHGAHGSARLEVVKYLTTLPALILGRLRTNERIAACAWQEASRLETSVYVCRCLSGESSSNQTARVSSGSGIMLPRGLEASGSAVSSMCLPRSGRSPSNMGEAVSAFAPARFPTRRSTRLLV